MSDNVLNLVLDDKNQATIHLFGATLTSWIHEGEEVILLSKKSLFDSKKAIRGGIPIVFPNFGPWDNGRPQHGFARIKNWSIKEPVNKTDEQVTVSLRLKDDNETRKLWNFPFELEYVVTLTKDKLTTALGVSNTGMDAFDFTVLLHTYLKVDDIANIEIGDLRDVEYEDKTCEGLIETETSSGIQIGQETDRVYKGAPNVINLKLKDSKKRVQITKTNLPDVVIWNPWIEKSKAMADFDDEEYKNMVCIEPGHVANRLILDAKVKMLFTQEIKVFNEAD